MKLTYFGSYKPLISNITKLNQDGNQSIEDEKLCLYNMIYNGYHDND